MATSAAHRVQGVTELLEMVLYELPPIDILVYKRVCRRWKGIITNSDRFQKAFFFEPVTTEILGTPRDLFFQAVLGEGSHTWYKNGSTKSQRVFLNPMLEHLFDVILAGDNNKWTSIDASWRRMRLTQPPSTVNLKLAPDFDIFELKYNYSNRDDQRFSRGHLELKTRGLHPAVKSISRFSETVEDDRQKQGLEKLWSNYQLEELPCNK